MGLLEVSDYQTILRVLVELLGSIHTLRCVFPVEVKLMALLFRALQRACFNRGYGASFILLPLTGLLWGGGETEGLLSPSGAVL